MGRLILVACVLLMALSAAQAADLAAGRLVYKITVTDPGTRN